MGWWFFQHSLWSYKYDLTRQPLEAYLKVSSILNHTSDTLVTQHSGWYTKFPYFVKHTVLYWFVGHKHRTCLFPINVAAQKNDFAVFTLVRSASGIWYSQDGCIRITQGVFPNPAQRARNEFSSTRSHDTMHYVDAHTSPTSIICRLYASHSAKSHIEPGPWILTQMESTGEANMGALLWWFLPRGVPTLLLRRFPIPLSLLLAHHDVHFHCDAVRLLALLCPRSDFGVDILAFVWASFQSSTHIML